MQPTGGGFRVQDPSLRLSLKWNCLFLVWLLVWVQRGPNRRQNQGAGYANAGEPEEGRAVISPRCTFPGCGRRLEFAPVEGVASSVGLGGVMRRSVCPDHPPFGACSRCGIMAGPQYMVKVLANGRCPDCSGKPVRAAVVIGRAPADLRLGKTKNHQMESRPV